MQRWICTGPSGEVGNNDLASYAIPESGMSLSQPVPGIRSGPAVLIRRIWQVYKGYVQKSGTRVIFNGVEIESQKMNRVLVRIGKNYMPSGTASGRTDRACSTPSFILWKAFAKQLIISPWRAFQINTFHTEIGDLNHLYHTNTPELFQSQKHCPNEKQGMERPTS